MDKCCNKTYKLCQPISGCWDSLYFRLPDSYTAESVKLKVSRNWTSSSMGLTQQFGVTDGWINLNRNEYPDGWFNPYGGPYCFELFTPEMQPIEILAGSGSIYSGVVVQFDSDPTPNEYVFINIFNNETPNVD